MSRWLVTGLPRSRTAWLSVLMNNAGAFCRHEPTRYAQSFEDLVASWPDGTGVCDAALGFQLKRLIDELSPRALIIERDVDDAKASFLRYMEGVPLRLSLLHEHADLLQSRMAEVLTHKLVRSLRYEALHDVNSVKWAMDWLVPGCDTSRVEEMMRLNIQVERRHALKEASEHNGWFLRP